MGRRWKPGGLEQLQVAADVGDGRSRGRREEPRARGRDEVGSTGLLGQEAALGSGHWYKGFSRWRWQGDRAVAARGRWGSKRWVRARGPGGAREDVGEEGMRSGEAGARVRDCSGAVGPAREAQ